MTTSLNDSSLDVELITALASNGEVINAWVHLACLVILSFLSVFGSIVNLIVFIIFYKRPSLRSISTRFILSLTTANLICSLIVAPTQGFRIGRQFLNSDKQPKGECLYIDSISGIQLDSLCQTCRILITIVTEAAILSVLLIAIDRYCAVTSPLHYSMTVTRGRSIRLIFIVWGISILYSTPLIITNFTKKRKHLPTHCWPESPPIITWFGVYYSAILGLFGFTIPLLVLVWIYIKMYRAAMTNSKRTRRPSVGANHAEIILPECPSTPESTHQHSTRGKGIRLYRKRSSNSSISSSFFKEESRAAKTGAIVISSFVTSWVPFFAYKLFESFYCYFPFVQNVTVLIALSSSCTMPFIYVYRNETVRNEAIKIICYWRSSLLPTSSYKRSSMQYSMDTDHTHPSVTVMEQNTGKLYSYSSAECDQCRSNKLVGTIKSYRQMETPVNEAIRQKSSVLKQDCTVSFKLAQGDQLARCRVCLRQDSSTSSVSSDEPHRLAKNNFSTSRWMRHRLSNGSVTTRSDSLASTNSSILSYGVHKWPRRTSTFSTDSGDTYSRKNGIEAAHETSTLSGTPKTTRNQHNLFKSQSIESEDDPREIIESDFHIYQNPFRIPKMLYFQEEQFSSPNRFIWEIEETESCDDESVIMENKFNVLDSVAANHILHHPQEMEDIQSMKKISRFPTFSRRFSQQEMKVESIDKRRSKPVNIRINSAHSMTEIPKYVMKHINDKENSSLTVRDVCRNNFVDQLFVHSPSSSVRSCDENFLRNQIDLQNI